MEGLVDALAHIGDRHDPGGKMHAARDPLPNPVDELRDLVREHARHDRQRDKHRDDHNQNHERGGYGRTVAEACERPLVHGPAHHRQNGRKQNSRQKRLDHKVAADQNQRTETDAQP